MKWQDWIGRCHSQSDILTPALVLRHRATFNMAPENLQPLLGIHWILNLPEASTTKLGNDGHPLPSGMPAGTSEPGQDTADFLPPFDLPRRMWASSTIDFLAPIPVGTAVTRTSCISDIALKNGTSGRLAFVTLDHLITVDSHIAVRERQALVYREAAVIGPPQVDNAQAGRGNHNPAIATNQTASRADSRHFGDPQHLILTPSTMLLFRFSALTFNSHRIHYDLPYARDVEGYPGLVVQAPLTATLLLNWATELYGSVRRFAFRAVAPAFAGEELTLVARAEGDYIALAALRPDATASMEANVSL